MSPGWHRALLTDRPLLDGAQCDSAVASLDDLRERWVQRHESAPFYTVGASNYFDLAGRGRAAPYDALARATNPLLHERLGWLYRRVAHDVGDALGTRCEFPPHLALPGFHVFLADERFAAPRAVMHADWFVERWDREQVVTPIHWDTPHRVVDWKGMDVDLDRQVSFTLSLEQPAGGAGMYVWDVHGEDTAHLPAREVRAMLDARAPVLHPYRRGWLTLHSGSFYHQAAPMPSMRPGERRITLQGHGVWCGERLQLFW